LFKKSKMLSKRAINVIIKHSYAAVLPRRGPHIASHSVRPYVRLSVCPSVRLSVRPVSGSSFVIVYITTVLRANIQNRKKLLFSLMGQRHVCSFRHPQRAAYRTAISAAQTCLLLFCRLRKAV